MAYTDLTAEKRIAKCRASLMLDHPWFGSLAMKVHMVPTDAEGKYEGQDIPAMATNAQVMVYNPKFVMESGEHELIGTIGHEVIHCALLHPFRRGARDAEKWNVACDYAVNQLCADSGLKLPAWAIQPNPAYKGMSADQIYGMMQEPQEKEKQGGKLGKSQDSPKGDAGKGDTPGESPSDGQMTESDWQIASKQAEMVAKKAGRMPGGMERGLAATRESKADWRALLQRFITSTVAHDYSWMRPNRRFIWQDIYLPGILKENMGKFVVAIDTSGSVTPKMLEQFAGEIQEIMQSCKPEEITVLYCDTKINRVDRFTPDGGEVKLTMCGGGGTAFSPVFKWVADAGGEAPKALIYLTDLDTYDTPSEPEYPVLWVTPDWVTQNPKWGEVVRIGVEC